MAQRRVRASEEAQQQDAASMMTQAVRRPKRSRGNDPQTLAVGSKGQRAQRDPADRPSGDAELATGAAGTAPAVSPTQPAPPARAAQRHRRGAASAPAAQTASASARPATAGTHHDRRPHAVPPPDHHAERRAASGATVAVEALPAPVVRPGRQRRGKRSAPNESDSDASPPRRPASAPQPSTPSDADGEAGAAPPAGAQASMFSPVFSLSGGKSAAELPDGGGGSETAPSGSSTPERSGRQTRSHTADRPAVCSPAKAGPRSTLDLPQPQAAAPQQQQQPQPVSDDENANSEHDTQIRLSSGPGVHADPLASASDADSSQARATPDTLALMCAGEAMSPESSDDEDAARAAADAPQPCSAGGPLQPLPGATLAAVPATAEEEYDEDEYMDFDPYLFIRKLPPLASVVTPVREVLLPRQTRASKRKTLVLDLDETLVHSSLDVAVDPHFTFPVVFGGREHHVSVRRRPHLAPFLERVAELFEVVVFTASQKIYAEQLLNMLDPERRLIRHRIFRDSCVYVEGNYLKDLSVLGRDLSHTIIIDNSPQAFGYQLANGIPIESWYDDEADDELLAVLPFLESLVDVPDVRPLIADAFKLRERVARAPSPELGRAGMAGYF